MTEIKGSDLPAEANLTHAPSLLNTSDKAMWVLGFNECRQSMLATPQSPVVPADQDLLEVARATGLRAHLHGVNATDARLILQRFVGALHFLRADSATPTGSCQPLITEPMMSDCCPHCNCDPLDTARLDSRRMVYTDRNDLGQLIIHERTGVNLRAEIDEAMALHKQDRETSPFGPINYRSQ